MKLKFYHKLLLSVASALMFSAGWTQWSLGLFAAFAFVPLLLIEYHDSMKKDRKRETGIFMWAWLSFLIWNIISTYWIYYSTLFGAAAAIFFLSLFMTCVFYLAVLVWRKAGMRIGLIAFVSFWLSFECLFLNSQISWPWLTLGNAFANNITIVQWYEFVGHLGGSFWVLVLNVLVFLILKILLFREEKKLLKRTYIALAVCFIIPVGYSLIRYYTYTEKIDPVDVVVIQPNIDPYYEKFETPAVDQISEMVFLINSKTDSLVDFVVCPETAMPTGMWENEMNDESTVKYLRDYLSLYPDISIIIGANTRMYYEEGEGRSKTAIRLGSTRHYYDLFNTSLMIDTSADIQIYHKSKLVPGVEMMPYPELLGFLGDFAVDLGGMQGSHGTQPDRTTFARKSDGLKTGTAICYESAYGEFFSEFVKNGAAFMCIITNDGWWSNTAGHRQHKSFASLRAIETRRSIARSANTGISCFVNQRGDILQATSWWKKDVIRAKLNLNHNLTFYTRYGDFLARMSLVLSGLIILITITRLMMRVRGKRTSQDL